MFGKPHDSSTPTIDDISSIEDILGDEVAAENAHEVGELRHRVEQVESQVNSQFTSLATYVQIAQEQVELARAEARAAIDRTEQRLTSLVERERADRLTALTGAPAGSAPDVAARIEALEHSVAHLARGLDESRQQQKDLALAITTMFERLGAPQASIAAADEPAPENSTDDDMVVPAPDEASAVDPASDLAPPDVATADFSEGPIAALALHG